MPMTDASPAGPAAADFWPCDAGLPYGLAAVVARLEELEVGHCAELDDAGLLGVARRSPQLRRLSACERITSVDDLAAAAPGLKLVDLHDLPNLSDGDILASTRSTTTHHVMLRSRLNAAQERPICTSCGSRTAAGPLPKRHST
jgi:hypothetical protein